MYQKTSRGHSHQPSFFSGGVSFFRMSHVATSDNVFLGCLCSLKFLLFSFLKKHCLPYTCKDSLGFRPQQLSFKKDKMMGTGDFLTLRMRNTDSNILKPWWDITVDYINLILALIAVVTGVVSLNAIDPICIPVVSCPATANDSLGNVSVLSVCVTYSNCNQSKKSVFDSDIVITTKSFGRNLFDYVNSECKRLKVSWFSKFFPNVLFAEVGACLLVHNIWLSLSASIIDHFVTILKKLYDNSTKKLKQREVQLYRKKLEEVENKLAESTSEHCPKIFPCCCCSIRCLYGLELGFQLAILLTSVVLNFVYRRFEERFTCNIDEIISGFTFDCFTCSYPLNEFYGWSFWAFWVALVIHLFVWLGRLISFIRMVCTNRSSKWKYGNDYISGDFAFLLNLLELSSPFHLEPLKTLNVHRVNQCNGHEYDEGSLDGSMTITT